MLGPSSLTFRGGQQQHPFSPDTVGATILIIPYVPIAMLLQSSVGLRALE